jgi:hypothetical protein
LQASGSWPVEVGRTSGTTLVSLGIDMLALYASLVGFKPLLLKKLL